MDAERRVERETFEKWGAVIYPFRRHDFDADIYAEPSTQAAWEAWQRAWSESRAALAAPGPAQADPWAWAVLLPGNTPQQARIRMTEREAMSCAAELPGFVIVPLYAATSRPGGAP